MLTDEQITALREAVVASKELTALAAAGDDHGLAAALNAKTLAGLRLVPNWEIKKYLILCNKWATIALVASNAAAPDEVRGLCISVIDWIDDRTGKILHTDRAEAAPMVGGLVQSQILTQEQADALLALADTTVSLAEQVCGVGFVITPVDVASVRTEPAE